LTVRLLAAADVEAYRALRLAGLHAHPAAFAADADDEAAWPAGDWLARLAKRTTFGAFLGVDLVGTVALAFQTGRKVSHRGSLVGVYVTPVARGSGAGPALIAAVVAAARGQVDELVLSVGIGNAPAIALYLACGFRPYAIDEDAIRVDGVRVDDVLMRLRL
jgi:ribosomal protein S18 acetylase RimI-like enzyme